MRGREERLPKKSKSKEMLREIEKLHEASNRGEMEEEKDKGERRFRNHGV